MAAARAAGRLPPIPEVTSGSGWPVVVGGCHRSGTSLLRRVLDAHPDIHCGPELTFFRDFYGEFADDPLRHLRFATTVRSVVDEDRALRILGGAFLELHRAAADAAGKRRWADKSPDNAVHLDGWQALLGDEWWYVHVVRNPLDTLASIAEARFPLTIPPGLDERIAFYNRYVEAGLRFAADHPDRAVVVVYDRFVADPEAGVERLMRAIGEEPSAAQLAFNAVTHQAGLEDPKVGATTTIHGEAVGRWAGVLSDDEAAAVRAATEAVWARAQSMG